MDANSTKGSFADLLKQTFQELSNEQKPEKKHNQKSIRSTTRAPRPQPNYNRNKSNSGNQRRDGRGKFRHNRRGGHNNRQRRGQRRNNQRHAPAKRKNNESDSSSDDSSDEQSNGMNVDDGFSNLQDFVVSLLRMASKQKMIISELGLKITDTFDKSIKQLSGLNSSDFFNKLKNDKIISIKQKKGLSFAYLITPKKAKKTAQKSKNEKLKIIQKPMEEEPKKMDTNPFVENDKKTKVTERESNSDSTDNVDAAKDNDSIIMVDNVAKKTETGKKEKGKTRSLILSDLVQEKRSKIMLSAMNGYCVKANGKKWRECIKQKPKEFINDMVCDGLVILDETVKNGQTYPFITLNFENETIKNMKMTMGEKEDENVQKEDEGEKIKDENEITLRGLIMSKLNSAKSKVFISTINGIALNHFEKGWNSVIKYSVDEFVEKMTKDKLVTIKGSENEKFIVLYEMQTQNIKKRKLNTNDDDEKDEPQRKKRKSNEQNLEKIELPPIRIKGQNGVEMAQQIVEGLKPLENSHEIHFHFSFDE